MSKLEDEELEQSSEIQEANQNPEHKAEVDAESPESQLSRVRQERTAHIDAGANMVKKEGQDWMDKLPESSHLSEAEIQALKKETQVDQKLEAVHGEIDEVANQAKEEIDNTGKAVEVEPTTDAKQTEEVKAPEKAEEGQTVESREKQEAKEKVMEESQEKRKGLATRIATSNITSTGLDLVPYVGSGKMIVEAIAGKDLTGYKMSGKERIVHGLLGAGCLTLELVPVAGTLGKDAVVVGGRSIVFLERAAAKFGSKGLVKAERIFQKSASFLARNPEITTKAEKYADKKLNEVVRNHKVNLQERRKAA